MIEDAGTDSIPELTLGVLRWCYKTITSRVKEIIMFTADNEREDGKKSAHILHQALGGRVISLPGRGHYVEKDMGTTEFPELLDAVLR